MLQSFEGLDIEADDIAPGLPADVVLGVGPAAQTLAWVTPRTPRGRALDIGTGNGVQALLAARHCRQVVATDVNPRAAELTRANAGRNGIANVDVRLGDLFEPVAGERFDLVVANPPFVVSPDSRFQFRDGGTDLCARLVGAVDRHLADGGLAVVMVNWVAVPGEPWWTVPRRWVGGARADTLLLRFGMDRAEDYVRRWNRYDPATDADTADRWLAWFRRQGIERIGAGIVVLRHVERRRPWARALDMPHGITGPCGDQLEAVLDAPRLRAVDGVRVRWAPRAVVADGWVAREPGLGVRAPVSAAAAQALVDGGVPTTDVLDELQRLVSLGLAEVDVA